jgi:2-amino-4-hydroxy-6-hydroxymethyldihydropteridine diphosphokinase
VPIAYIGVGSNINPSHHVRKALQVLALFTEVTGLSMVYRTPAESRKHQNAYYNCVVEIHTTLNPKKFKFELLRKIEELCGRIRTKDKFASRTIDLDLIIYDSKKIKSRDLTLPDPDILERPYLAIPLYELNPKLILPGYHLKISEIISNMKHAKMKPLINYTNRLKKTFAL